MNAQDHSYLRPPPAITGRTASVWIVGDPIEQVKAPQVMNPHYQREGLDLLVLPAQVAPEHLRVTFEAVRHMPNLRGWIVTVPHKAPVAGWLDELSLAARVAGAVNVVRFRDGKTHGDLFDGVGFTTSLRQRGHVLKGQSALVMGAGGVGSAIALALGQAGARRIAIHDIDAGRADALARRLGELSSLPVRFERASPQEAREFDLIVNASPLGMAGDARSPIDPMLLLPRHTVAEVVMTPEVTPLLQAAHAVGCEVHPGRQVLEGQLELLLAYFR